MRKDLFIAFLGFWVAIVPWLPISAGSTQKFTLMLSGLVIAILALWSFNSSHSP